MGSIRNEAVLEGAQLMGVEGIPQNVEGMSSRKRSTTSGVCRSASSVVWIKVTR